MALGIMAIQFAFWMAPGVSMSALTVPAIDAKMVPRMVCGLVNLYSALPRALMDPACASDRALAMLSMAKQAGVLYFMAP